MQFEIIRKSSNLQLGIISVAVIAAAVKIEPWGTRQFTLWNIEKLELTGDEPLKNITREVEQVFSVYV